jgi:hypothetical protein
LEEALKARPLEYDHDSPSFKALNTHYNNRLEVLKCQLNALGSIWHPDPVDIQRTLRELLETNCVELIQLQCVKDHFSGSQAYDWISDYMLEHYPKSKRAELRRKELLDEKKV